MMCGMEFFPGLGLGKDQQGLPEFVDLGIPRPKKMTGIGYGEENDSDTELDIWGQLDKEAEVEAKKKTLKMTFFREGTKYPYQGTPEPILMAGKVIPGFEIFAYYVNRGKRAVVNEAPVIVEELIMDEEESE